MQTLLEKLWTSGQKSLDPIHFLSTVWTLMPIFQEKKLQDAQEFLRFILGAIESENVCPSFPHPVVIYLL